MSQVTNALTGPEVYYQHSAKTYWVKDRKGKWIQLNEESLKRYLKSEGYINMVSKDQPVSELDEAILNIQLENNVDHVGGLAGYAAGAYELGGKRILVNESPVFIEANEGKWPLLKEIFDGMFIDGDLDQTPYVYGWLKEAIKMHMDHRWTPGQALAIAGPPESGKSIFQRIVTLLLGGRSANPYLFMTGRTTFNAELFRAEHLMIEDQAESIDIRKRRSFAASIKEIAVNQDQHCHGKNKEGLTLRPFWRITISLNDDPERMLVLPPMDEDVADKIMLLKVNKRPMPMPTSTGEEKQLFWSALQAELPAFIEFLNRWEIPNDLKGNRFGIKSFHHPELLNSLSQASPETALLNLIDQEIFTRLAKPWKGTAAQLQQVLTAPNSDVKRQAELLLGYSSTCGTYLGRLKKDGNRVSQRTVRGQTIWTIDPPDPTQLGEGVEHVFDSNEGKGRFNIPSPGKEVQNLGHPPTLNIPPCPILGPERADGTIKGADR